MNKRLKSVNQSLKTMNEWLKLTNQSLITINQSLKSINYWKAYFAILNRKGQFWSFWSFCLKQAVLWQIPACILEICQTKEKKLIKFENRQISRFEAYFAIFHRKGQFCLFLSFLHKTSSFMANTIELLLFTTKTIQRFIFRLYT